jgi:hypothetical protein
MLRQQSYDSPHALIGLVGTLGVWRGRPQPRASAAAS